MESLLIIDYDRTLCDVDAGIERLYETASRHHVDTKPIRIARKRIEDDGGTFAPLELLREQLDAVTYRSLCLDFVENGKPGDILYPDARRLLARLVETGMSYIVMTYGVDAEWQRLKLQAAGHPMDYIIVNTPDKGTVIASWQQDDGNYDIRTDTGTIYHVRTLVLIDDKAQAFTNLPQDHSCTGLWVQRNDLLLSQQGVVPANVQIIHSLDKFVTNNPPAAIRP